ncbi:MAG TPA: EVE domain-containing protein [Nitrososphaera sp.]|jgi:predicted RNA-binding protein with PUA-like domain|nr:EVE domain-containing protein [Nitrososphaera sp.]
MAYWLFKQEPSAYNFSDLEEEKETVWDGVSNNLALKHLRNVKRGDKVFFYHSGEEKRIVGIMEVASAGSGRDGAPVVNVKPLARLDRPVPLDIIKSDKSFSSWELVRISRLSVMPVPSELWAKILKLSKV